MNKGKPHTRERIKQIFEEAKKERFAVFIKKYRDESLIRITKRLKKNKSLQKLQKRSRQSLRNYQKTCRVFTEIVIQSESIDTTDRHFDKVHIDHIIPVYHGWIMGITPYLIAMGANLQRLTKEENKTKGRIQLLLNP